jgi:hypothetical protein
MRWLARAAACASVLVSAGCNLATEGLYYREGIGTGLYRSELAGATDLQDQYVLHICRQAGLSCTEAGLDSREWMLFVQAGMNDIDLRCDGYLAWLDNRRRSSTPILNQLAATSTATQAILRVTGAGATPITIVGIAFGLAADTFTNVNSRLLFEINQSTVQSVVLGHQTDFRIRASEVLVTSRPMAIYLLRNYLRICMPFSIETSINNTISVYHRAGPQALETVPLATRGAKVAGITSPPPPPAVIRITEPSRTGTRSTDPVREASLPPQVITSAKTEIERTISLASGKAIQRILCVPDSGDFDVTTRSALRDFKAALLHPDEAAATDSVDVDADLRKLREAVAIFRSCRDAGLMSPYEAGVLVTNGAERVRGYLVKASVAAKIVVPADLNTPTSGGGMSKAMRTAVGALRTSYSMKGQPVIDRSFFETMTKSISR